MKADPQHQRRLLDLQATDTRLDQLAHAVRTLPAHKELEELGARLATLDVEIVNAQTAYSDIQRELTKSEADVELVRSRAARDRDRLDAGTGTAKELQGLQSELESLHRRQGELEDIQLAVMERADEAQSRVGELTTERDDLAAKYAEVQRDKGLALEGFSTEAAEVEARRAAIVPEVAPELLALYDKIRGTSGGIGAAELNARRCGGCRLELNALELNRIRGLSPDEVVRCEECQRILVRTGESGL